MYKGWNPNVVGRCWELKSQVIHNLEKNILPLINNKLSVTCCSALFEMSFTRGEFKTFPATAPLNDEFLRLGACSRCVMMFYFKRWLLPLLPCSLGISRREAIALSKTVGVPSPAHRSGNLRVPCEREAKTWKYMFLAVAGTFSFETLLLSVWLYHLNK